MIDATKAIAIACAQDYLKEKSAIVAFFEDKTMRKIRERGEEYGITNWDKA